MRLRRKPAPEPKPNPWAVYGHKVYKEKIAALEAEPRKKFVTQVAEGCDGWHWQAAQMVRGISNRAAQRVPGAEIEEPRLSGWYFANDYDYAWTGVGASAKSGVATTKAAAIKAARLAREEMECRGLKWTEVQ